MPRNNSPHPAATSRIPFNDLLAQHRALEHEIRAALERVIAESGFIRGPEVAEFERGFAALNGAQHCVSCANGTDALFIVMKGLGLRPGDEVITTAHSWISTPEAISLAGGRVVFCDTDDSFTLDPARLASLVTPRTVGVLPVHLYGQPADMLAIGAFAQKHGLWVVEDCAQAHLASCAGRLVGGFGRAAAFSFYPGKNLGAMGDAGGILTNDDELARWFELFARHGGKGIHLIEGINSRLDGLQAAVLNVKMPHLGKWTARRREIAAIYAKRLGKLPGIRLPLHCPERVSAWHAYAITSPRRDALKEHLARAGIETMINYPQALPFYPAYAGLGHQPGDFPTAVRHAREILSLPIFPEMTGNQVERVCDEITTFTASSAP